MGCLEIETARAMIRQAKSHQLTARGPLGVLVALALAMASCSPTERAAPITAPRQPPPAPNLSAPTPTASAAQLVRAQIDRGVAPSRIGQSRLTAIVERAIAGGACPGVVMATVDRGHVVISARGDASVVPERTTMQRDALFDLASLTKPLVTATAIFQLAERGALRLDDPVAKHLPAFAARGKARTTVMQLLEHQSGLPAANAPGDYRRGKAAALDAIFDLRTSRSVGTRVYSDVGYIVLGALVESVTGTTLDRYAASHIFTPLAMRHTTYAPTDTARAVPTERGDGAMLRGIVHDPRARLLDGVAGHAGLFSTAGDLATFVRMLLAGGELDGARVLSARSVELLLQRVFVAQSGGFGHTGFTGTSLWLDPTEQLGLIILSSRLHPDGAGDVSALRRELRHEVARAAVAKPRVRTGLDVLRAHDFVELRGARVGLITNHSARAHDGRRAVDLLHAAPEVSLVALFSPEHGLGGDVDAEIADGRDDATGLPIYSLYGPKRRPTTAQLRGIDTLVFDIQDAGARFYTYATTLGYALETAAANGLAITVLDRPNPIDGVHVEGPVLDASRRSFIGYHTIALRHGMTLGELARMFDAERKIGAKLSVIAMEGWQRGMRFEDTGLTWIDPSPNLKSAHATLLYPGVALLEATNVSVGRGTDTPFELVGAPWMDGAALAAAMAGETLTVEARAATFTPRSGRFSGQLCHGVRLRVTDRKRHDAVRVGIALAHHLRRIHASAWRPESLLTLLGNASAYDAVLRGVTVDEVVGGWRDELEAFSKRRAAYLLY